MPETAKREVEVVGLVEKLVAHVAAADGNRQAEYHANLGYYLRILSSNLSLGDYATDEFSTLHQAKRRLTRHYGDSGREKGQALCTQLDELHRKLRSPALAPLLTKRWAVLHTLVSLCDLPLNGSAGGVGEDLIQPSSSSSSFWAAGLNASVLRSSSSSLLSRDSRRGGNSLLHSSDHGRKARSHNRARIPAPPPSSSYHHDQHHGGTALSGEETGLLRDLLFVFQGINGQSIRYDAASATHVLDPQLSVSVAVKDELLRMSELGWLFRRVQAFVEGALSTTTTTTTSHRSSSKHGTHVGLVGQAFCYVLQEEMTEYYRLISILESQLGEEEEEEGGGDDPTLPAEPQQLGGLTLKRLAVWVDEPLDKMRVLATLCDSLSVVRGGAMASVLFAHTKQGDPLAKQLVQRITGRVATPIFDMIRSWVFEGELVDRHGEFFVEVRLPDLHDSDERLWHQKYALRTQMLPRFIPKDLATKILVIGKSINFMRRCCKDKEWISSQLKTRMETEELSYEKVDALQQVVDGIAQVVNQRLLHLLMGRYELMTHFRALKKFMILGQGDFVICLMDMIGPDLSKISTQVYRHDLTGKLEAALRSSNAQFEQLDILNRVGVRLLEPSAGEDGWEVFSLDYQVEAPISAIIHSASSDSYSRLFHLLWRVKRVEWSLATSWKQHMLVGHSPMHKLMPQFGSILHRCNMARGEMVHFVSNLSNFMMFAVVETSWTDLQRAVREDAKDLDGIIRAHDDYLRTILDKAFLSQDKYDLHSALQAVLNMILEFCNLHYNLCVDVMKDQRDRSSFQEEIARRTAAGQWGLSREEEEAHWAASNAILKQYQHRVEATTSEYERTFGKLMELLQQQEGDSDAMRFLIFTLDFNHFYAKRHHHSYPTRRSST